MKGKLKKAFPVALYCDCGAHAEYNFQTEGAQYDFLQLWSNTHGGHQALTASEWQQQQARRLTLQMVAALKR